MKDHVFFGRGRNVLLVSYPAAASPREREHETLRAYRDGRFFGLLGALKTDESVLQILIIVITAIVAALLMSVQQRELTP